MRSKTADPCTMLKTAEIGDGPGPRQEMDPVALDTLIASVRRRGLLQPLRVRREGGGHVCVIGRRRLEAARAAGLEVVPCLLLAGEPGAADVLEEQLAEQLAREDLRPLDLSRALRHLQRLRPELTQTEIAERVGVSQATVSRALALIDDLTPAVQDLVHAGELAPSTAAELHGLPAEEQVAVAGRIAAAGESRAAVREKRKPAPERAVFKFETARGWKIQLTAPRKRATEAQAREALAAFLAEGAEAAAEAA